MAVVLAAAGLTACGGGGGDDAAPDEGGVTTTTSADAASGESAVACGALAEVPAVLDADQARVLAELTDALGLVEAPPYPEFRVVCDSVGATSAQVPTAWDDETPGPDDPPRAGVTVGPDLTAVVQAEPVVFIGAGRFVGDPPAASFIIENIAAGTLENGARTLPRRGDSIPEGCDPLDPVPYRAGEYHGEIQPYAECDGEARGWLVAAAFPDDGGQYQTQLIGQALNTADLEALVRALVTLEADPDHVPGRELPPLPTVGPTP